MKNTEQEGSDEDMKGNRINGPSPLNEVVSSISSSLVSHHSRRRGSISSSSAAGILHQSSFLPVPSHGSHRASIVTGGNVPELDSLVKPSPDSLVNDSHRPSPSHATLKGAAQSVRKTKDAPSEQSTTVNEDNPSQKSNELMNRENRVSLTKNTDDLKRLVKRSSSELSCTSSVTHKSTTSCGLSISVIKRKVDALEIFIKQNGIDDDNSEYSCSVSCNDNEEENNSNDDFDYQETIKRIDKNVGHLKISEFAEENEQNIDTSVKGKKMPEWELDEQNDRSLYTVEEVLRNENILPFSIVELRSYLEDERRQLKVKSSLKCQSIAESDATQHIATKPGIFRSGDDKRNTNGRQTVEKFFGNGIFSSILPKSIGEMKSQKIVTVKADTVLAENDQIKHSVHHEDECLPQQILQGGGFSSLGHISLKSLSNDESLREAFMLHFIFRKFSSPSPSFDSIQALVENERLRMQLGGGKSGASQREITDSVFLPQDVVINMGHSCSEFTSKSGEHGSSLVASVLRRAVLVNLPAHFRLAFVRVLIRLLNGETDAEYNDALSLLPPDTLEASKRESKPRKRPRKGGNMAPTTPQARRQMYSKYGRGLSSKTESWTQRNEDLGHLYERNKKRNNLSFHSLYSVVRFRCAENAGSKVDAVLEMIEIFLQPSPNKSQSSDESLMRPLCRLLGLLCTAGISPQELSRIFSLIKDGNYRMNINIHVLRALIVATEGSSLASKLRGKASPQHFFCFGHSDGLSQTIRPTINLKAGDGWPFQTTFGMACWFRVERFCSIGYHILFKICSGDGTAFEVSFKRLESRGSKSDDAAHIVFSVRDSERSRKIAQTQLSRSIEVTGFPIVPQVWFHLSIRHTKKKYLGISKDEVTILLDGKSMLTEHLRFPKASAIGDGSGLKQDPTQPIAVTFCAGLDVEAGTLYVFDDIVTDETLKSLSKYTSGKVEQNSRHAITSGIIATIEKKVNPLLLAPFLDNNNNPMMGMKKADVEEMAVPRERVQSSSRSMFSASKSEFLPQTLDLIGDDELQNELHNPTNGEFSRQAFKSNIFFVWDPTRLSEQSTILEAHSGIHTTLDGWNCVPWQMGSAKDVISSIGGVQALLPVLKALIFPDESSKSLFGLTQKEKSQIGAAVPLAFTLITAFLRDNDNNGREWLRCGGTEIVEHFLLQSKKRYGSASHRKDFWDAINAFRQHSRIAEELLSVLIDLKEACAYNTNLESKIYSRLLVNIDLWLSGLSDTPGTALHGIMLPTISSLVKADPDEAMKAINTNLMLNWIREYTIMPQGSEGSDCFDATSHDRVLTHIERSHFVDVIMGILFTLMSVEVSTSNLLPLIQFISFNLDNEWEANNDKGADIELTENATETRYQRFAASEKSCALLMLLLETRPVIPGLFEALNDILGDTVCWLLCCMVHSYNDKMRSNGIRCFTALYDIILPQGEEEQKSASSITMFGAKRAVSKVSRTIKNVGTGLGVKSKGYDTSPKALSASYNLLWHILKCHRHDLDSHCYTALLNLLVRDEGGVNEFDSTLTNYLIEDNVLRHGYRLNYALTNKRGTPLQSPMLKVRNTYASSSIFQLLRFLQGENQERWLFDLLTLLRVNSSTIDEMTRARDWQHCLFHVASDTVEELSNYNLCKWASERGIGSDIGEPSHDLKDHNSVLARFDLSFQLYATLLAHTLRDDNESISTLELAASLQRVCVNGASVFSILLSHVLNDLITHGTLVLPTIRSPENHTPTDYFALQESARAFFQMDVSQAAKHWKKLRHLSAIVMAVVNSNGYGLVDLFDYGNNLSSVLDDNSGGVYGIRLCDRNSSGILASDVMAETRAVLNKQGSNGEQTIQSKQHYRRICTTLSSQILELLDPFIFPVNVEANGVSQQNVLALVRSIEPRLGCSQGPLVASLVRFSLVLLSNLEPSGKKFLKSASMLRCFLHWCLDMARDARTISEPPEEELKQLDRLFVCTILQCHRSLSKCSSVLTAVEMSPEKYFTSMEQSKHLRRLYRVVEILGDIVLDMYKGVNTVLLDCISHKAYKALELAIATKDEWAHNQGDLDISQHVRRKGLKAFLLSDWVRQFHDNDYTQTEEGGDRSIAIPEQLKSNLSVIGGAKEDRAMKIMKGLAIECKDITEEFHHTLDIPFIKYLESQKTWTDTTAVRDLEYNGNLSINNLAAQYRSSLKSMIRSDILNSSISSQHYASILQKIPPTKKNHRWKLAPYTDRLHRRILLIPNINFDDHASASYDLALGIERDKALKEREERLRAKREEELTILYKVAKEGIVKEQERSEIENADDADPGICEDDNISSSEDSRDFSIGPLSDDEVVPGELITDWDRIDERVDTDDMILDAKHENGSYLWSKEYIWQQGERLLLYLQSVHIVTVETILVGELVLTTHSLYFRPTKELISVITKEAMINSKSLPRALDEGRWRLNRLSEVYERRYMLRTQAIELFFADQHELFINFCGGIKERDKFVEKLHHCKTPLIKLPRTLNPKQVFKRRFPLLTQRWQERKISNFEYLMQLNLLAGRTYNDISQYPVFPWIIADYKSEELDLTNPKSFRDLKKPVGALNPDRLLQLLERYHDLDGLSEEERFLYGSHYSSPGVVLHFLLRQEPFTTMAIELQSGRFDCPDRLFYDIDSCWHSCMNSTSDVKELIPEFFTCPEMFLNTNDFPLGETQAKIPINNVRLPPWADESPHEFVRINRLALESEYVSNNLHHWIDLVFGFKQRGVESVKANNVFHFLSYEGSVDLDLITDEIDRKATESQIQHFGQTPSQLLTASHPPRHPATKCWKPIISEILPAKRLMCYTPFKQFGGNRNKNTHGPAISIQLLPDHIFVVYADLSVGSYKWAPSRHGKTPFYLRMDKIRLIASREMSCSKFALGVHTGSAALDSANVHSSPSVGIGNWSFAMKKGSGCLSDPQMDATSNHLDATLLSCGYCDNSLKAHSLDGLRLKCSKRGGHLGAINCLQMDEEGTLLISGGEDATCRVWAIECPEIGEALIDSFVKTAEDQTANEILMCCRILWGHRSPISSLAFDIDLDVAVSGSTDGLICIHTVRCGKFIRSLQVQEFFPPTNFLASNGNDSIIGVRKLAIHKDGLFVAHLETGLLQMYSINGVKLGCIDAGEKLNAMEMIPGGHSLVTGGESGHVIIRSLRNLEIRYVLDLSDYGPIHSLAFTPPSNSIQQFMFVGTADGSITISSPEYSGDTVPDEVDDEDPGAQYTQHQVVQKESKSWWR